MTHGDPSPSYSPDATLRALGLLETPAGRVEDRDTLHARGVQETATAVWLAVSPPRAAPAEILENIHARCGIRSPGQEARGKFHRMRVVAMAGGWAAAVVACAGWWRAASGSLGSPDAVQALHNSQAAAPAGPAPVSPGAQGNGRPGGGSPLSARRPTPAPSPTNASKEDDERLRGELKRLRALVAEADTPRPGEARPRVRELRPPGSAPRSAKAASARVTAALTSAMERVMREDSGRKEASLVIEDGWVNGEGLELPEDGTVLHRHFPAEEWAARGLWKSEDGRYYDPVGDLVWSPGSGKEFLGRKAHGHEDLTAFTSPQTTATAAAAPLPSEEPPPATVASARDVATAQSATSLAPEVPEPEGYVVEDPASGDATLLVQNLPAAETGTEHVAVFTTMDGSTVTWVLADATTGLRGGFVGSSNGKTLSAGGGGYIYLNNYSGAMLGNTSTGTFSAGSGLPFSIVIPAGGFSSLTVAQVPQGSVIVNGWNLPNGSQVLLESGGP